MGVSARLARGFLMLVLSSWAGGAWAQYTRTGLLKWVYDDITVRSYEGRRRASGWSQSYDYSMEGPLASGLIGEGGASVNFSRGKSLAQTVASADADQKMLGYSFHGSLLPPGLRRYVTLAPSLSRARASQAWGEPRTSRDLADENRALTLGLSLPKLPSVSISRSRISRRDLSSLPSVEQDTEVRNEQAAYAKGPLRLQYRKDGSRVADRLFPSSSLKTEQTSGEAELNFTELKGRLQRAFLRASYQGQSSDAGGIATRQDFSAASVYLATRQAKRGRWNVHLGYGSDFSRSNTEAGKRLRNNALLVSNAPLRGGQLSNQLGYSRSDGRAQQQSVSESAAAEWRRSPRAGFRVNADGGWAWDRHAGAALSDSLRQRTTLTPRPSYDLYLEFGTLGASPLAGRPGGSRQHGLGAGLALRPAPLAELSGNYAASRSRSFADGSARVNHSVSAQAQASPLDRLKTTATYSLTWNGGSQGPAGRSSVLNAAVDYAPCESARLGGELVYGRHALNAVLSGSYTIGRTRLMLRFERQELYTINSYSHLSLSLSRYL